MRSSSKGLLRLPRVGKTSVISGSDWAAERVTRWGLETFGEVLDEVRNSERGSDPCSEPVNRTERAEDGRHDIDLLGILPRLSVSRKVTSNLSTGCPGRLRNHIGTSNSRPDAIAPPRTNLGGNLGFRDVQHSASPLAKPRTPLYDSRFLIRLPTTNTQGWVCNPAYKRQNRDLGTRMTTMVQ